MQHAWARALAIGIAVGVVLLAATFGFGISHRVCGLGAIVGWSGPLATPINIALAPPGGFESHSDTILVSWGSAGSLSTSGGVLSPHNWSTVDFNFLNWTYRAGESQLAAGWGASPTCHGGLSANGNVVGNGLSGCTGCLIANATAGGIVQRLAVPSLAGWPGYPFASVNLSYPSNIFGAISWNETSNGVVQWSASPSLQEPPISIAPFYFERTLIGLGITVVQSQVSFGVPIHFVNGTTAVYSGSFPSSWPAGQGGTTTLWTNDTYVFPAAGGQGTWAVYLAGGGDTLSVGGLLFEQTS